MTLIIRERKINDIPTIEVVPKELASAPLPLIIYYHGWRNNKELMLTQARRLAQKNFRVILPDSMNHGQRRLSEISSIPGVTFWASIQYNLIEFQQLVAYFAKRHWILDERIGVGGYSMGGITTAALLSQHPEIKVATSIMGTPQPFNYLQLMQQRLRQKKLVTSPDLNKLLSWVPIYDLSLQPEKIKQRPFLLWHGTEDEKIPFSQSYDFYLENKEMPYAKNMTFLTGKDAGHLVTIELMDRIADFFAEHL